MTLVIGHHGDGVFKLGSQDVGVGRVGPGGVDLVLGLGHVELRRLAVFELHLRQIAQPASYK